LILLFLGAKKDVIFEVILYIKLWYIFISIL